MPTVITNLLVSSHFVNIKYQHRETGRRRLFFSKRTLEKLLSIVRSVRKKIKMRTSAQAIFICDEKSILARICNTRHSLWKQVSTLMELHYLGLSQSERGGFGMLRALGRGSAWASSTFLALTVLEEDHPRYTSAGAGDITNRKIISSPIKERMGLHLVRKKSQKSGLIESFLGGNYFETIHTYS